MENGKRGEVLVSALQFACTDDVSTNVAKAERLVRAAHAQSANIILIQELFESYYFCQAQRRDFFQQAQPHNGHPTIIRMQKLAKELGVVIPISFFEEANNAHYNSTAILMLMELTLASIGSPISPMDQVFQTKFAKIGVVCWDQWFPEAARAMVLQGAEILFYPTAIGSEPQDDGLDSCEHQRRVMQGHAGTNVILHLSTTIFRRPPSINPQIRSLPTPVDRSSRRTRPRKNRNRRLSSQISDDRRRLGSHCRHVPPRPAEILPATVHSLETAVDFLLDSRFRLFFQKFSGCPILVKASPLVALSLRLCQVPLVASNRIGKEIIGTEHGNSEITFLRIPS